MVPVAREFNQETCVSPFFLSLVLTVAVVVVVNLASRKRELVYWVVLRSDPTVVPAVVWRLFY